MSPKKPTFSSLSNNNELDISHLNTKKDSASSISTIVSYGAVIVIVSSVTFIATIMMPSSNTVKKSQYFANEPTPIARAYETYKYRDISSIGGMIGDDVKLKVNKTDVGLDAIDSELHEKCLKLKYPKRARDVMNLGYISGNTKQIMDYMNCSMTIQKSRFCDSYYSKRLATRLTATIKKHKAMQKKIKKILGSKSVSGHTSRMMLRVDNGMKDQETGGIRSGRNTGPIISASVGQNISELSKHGLFSKSDFGVSIFANVPPEIEKYIKEQTVDVCPSTWF